MVSLNDGHAIVCPPVLGLSKSHLRCCEPHLSHHPTIDFVDFHFSLLRTKHQIAHRILILDNLSFLILGFQPPDFLQQSDLNTKMANEPRYETLQRKHQKRT
jgi:hypothetical protein